MEKKGESDKGLTLVVKVEIAYLLDVSGNFDKTKMDRLARLISGIRNSGMQVVIVTSGAIYLGSKIMGIQPARLHIQQALAAIGQVRLMELYQQSFGVYNQVVAQILMTADVVKNPLLNQNARNTLSNLLSKGVIPVVNENDSVSTEDIELNDNYYLVLRVAGLVDADILLAHLNHEGKYLLIWGEEKEEKLLAGEQELLGKLLEVKKITDNTIPRFPTIFPRFDM